MINMVIDFAPIIRMVDLMNEVGDTVSARTAAGKELRGHMIEAIHEGVRTDLHREAQKNINKIAHVYQWGYNIVDEGRTFKADPESDSPLWDIFLNNSGAKSKAYIEFETNNQWAFYDSRVYNIPMKKPGNLGRHVFYDQAEKLESIRTIFKDSEEPSEYRTNAYGKKGPPKSPRIQQLEGGRLVSYDTYQRDNAFFKQFSTFFANYKSQKLSGMGSRVAKNLDIDFQKVLDEELSDQQAKSIAALALSPGAAAGAGIKFSGDGGRLILRMPEPKNKGKVTKAMVKSAKKRANKKSPKPTKKVRKR